MSDGNYLAMFEDAQNALVQSGKVIQALRNAITAMKPQADIGAAVMAQGKVFTIPEVAKEIAVQIRPGKYIGQNQLYAFLRRSRILMRRKDPTTGRVYHQPYQDQIDAGRMKVTEYKSSDTEDGSIIVNRKTIVYPSGVVYIRERILKAIEAGVIDELIDD